MKNHNLNTHQIGGIILIAATVIMFAGAAVANFTLALGQTGFGGDTEQIRAAIAAQPSAWRLADILILVAIILTALGLVPITHGFESRGHTWAKIGLLAFSISAVLGVTRRIISIYLEPWVVETGIAFNDSTVAAFSIFGRGLGEWFTLLAFIAVALYGFALHYRPATSLIGWLFVVFGIVGVILHLVGAGIPAFIFMETGALGAVILLRERLSVASAV